MPDAARRLFCNRTLNLRAIKAVGFDMDYTLIHYHAEHWERRAYEYAQQRLGEWGVNVDGLAFDPSLVRPGLVIDRQLGNVVKANRFGYVKQACHGTQMLGFDGQRSAYARERVDLDEPRWVFMDTLFSLSEACLFLQLVDRLDSGDIADVHGYGELYKRVKQGLDAAHIEGALKAEIVQDPQSFVDLDPELALTLLDLKHAGKDLALITNSEWSYTRDMMAYALDPFLPEGQSWRDIFDLVIVSARKPSFWQGNAPAFEVVDPEQGLLRPQVGPLSKGHAYLGGHAAMVEQCFGVRGEEILYVGDHIYADVHVSKSLLRWRTALVARELEEEVRALQSFKARQAELTSMMEHKERLEHDFSDARLKLQRLEGGYGPAVDGDAAQFKQHMQQARAALLQLDSKIAAVAQQAAVLGSERWGMLLRAGNDKSRLARSIESFADIYTSRVSNFLLHTPFAYLRSTRGSMPHDHGPSGGVQ